MTKDDGSYTFRSPLAEQRHNAYLNSIKKPSAIMEGEQALDEGGMSDGEDIVILIYEVQVSSEIFPRSRSLLKFLPLILLFFTMCSCVVWTNLSNKSE